MKAKWNLNEEITVELTEEGRHFWRKYVSNEWDTCGGCIYTGEETNLTFQMWEFIQIFGESLKLGGKDLINYHVEINGVLLIDK